MGRYLLMLLLMIASASHGNTLPTQITLATTNWCPYACEDSEEYPGIIYDYITKLLNQKDIQVTIKFYPWARAIELANSGKVDGLLTAVQSEAPNLIFTTIPTDHYQMCFFTRPESTWSFENNRSLEAIRFGVIDGYGYGDPVDTYLKGSPNNIDSIASGGIATLNGMLASKRFDAFIDDSKVVRWSLKGQFKHLRVAGCLEKNPFYLAINPNRPWAIDFVNWLGFQLKASRFVLRNIQDAYY